MKTLFLLFILDFSGSMYQTINGETKVKILKDNVQALHQSLPTDKRDLQSGVMVFGLNPKLKCEDIQYNEQITSSIPNYVNKLSPGAFSRTPLAESIKRSTDITIKNKVKQLVIFSDGADTCGRDPCLELVRANDKLKAANYVMNIKFIGLNLRDDDEKFECFRNNKLSNINIDYVNITDAFEVQKILKKGLEDSLETIQKPFGLLSVQGAPSDIKFEAISTQTAKKLNSKPNQNTWSGAYQYKLVEGTYIVSASHPKSRKVKVYIEAENEKKMYWEDFFARPDVVLKYKKPPISFVLMPSLQTIESHRKKVGTAYIEAQKGNLKEYQIKIPFGEWKLQIVSPAWVNSSSEGGSRIKLSPMEDRQIDFSENLNFKWVTVPDPTKRWVFEVFPMDEKKLENSDSKKDKRKRYFLESDEKMIPINQADDINWLETSP